jgi:hypothetical protein
MFLMPSLSQLTVICAIAGACFSLVFRRNGKSPPLEVVVTKLLCASLIPIGVMLMLCAFDTSLLALVADAGLYIAAAGIALLVVAIKGLCK